MLLEALVASLETRVNQVQALLYLDDGGLRLVKLAVAALHALLQPSHRDTVPLLELLELVLPLTHPAVQFEQMS